MTQDGVILLHGLAGSTRQMERMRRHLAAAGYATLNVGYPGHFDLEATAAHVRDQTSDWIGAVDGDLHFVTHSMGGLVARILIRQSRPNRLGRVVMLGPPNQGSEIADLLAPRWAYRRLLGPAAIQLTTTGVAALDGRLGAIDYPLGIIAGSRWINPLGPFVLPGPHDGTVAVLRTTLPGMSDHIVLHTTHTFMMRNRTVIAATIRFLRDGRFAEERDSLA